MSYKTSPITGHLPEEKVFVEIEPFARRTVAWYRENDPATISYLLENKNEFVIHRIAPKNKRDAGDTYALGAALRRVTA